MKNKPKLIIKIIIYIIAIILGSNLASIVIDNVTTNNIAISSKISASNELRMANTTTSDNFFYDVSSIFYQSHPDSTFLVNQFNNSTFLYNGIKLPESPTLSIGATVDSDFLFGLVIKFASIKEPILGFQLLLREQFTLYGSVIFTNNYSSSMRFNRTDNIVNGYRIWNIEPTTATGDSLYFVFNTGYTTTTINRPFDLIQYQMIGNPNEAYDNGYNVGYKEGESVGYQNGYNMGYDKAIGESVSSPEHIFYGAWALLKTFGELAFQFFSIPVFGDLTLGLIFVVIPFIISLIQLIINILIKFIGLGGSNS